MSTRSHQKLVVERASVDHDAFADFYHIGSPVDMSTPLVIYFGGAISTDVYDARRDTEPLVLVDLFEDAVSRTAVESVDLLAVPCPLIGRTYPGFRHRVMKLVFEELLPRTPNPDPRPLAFFGNSAGAYIAAVLAFELTRPWKKAQC